VYVFGARIAGPGSGWRRAEPSRRNARLVSEITTVEELLRTPPAWPDPPTSTTSRGRQPVGRRKVEPDVRKQVGDLCAMAPYDRDTYLTTP
jgi:hypothetical protein